MGAVVKAVWREIMEPMLQGIVRLFIGIIPSVDEDQIKQLAWRWNVAKFFTVLFICQGIMLFGFGVHIAEACGWIPNMPGFVTETEVSSRLTPISQELHGLRYLVKVVAGSNAGRDLRDAMAQKCNLEKVLAKEQDVATKSQLTAVMAQLQNDVTKAQEQYYKFMGAEPRTPMCSEL